MSSIVPLLLSVYRFVDVWGPSPFYEPWGLCASAMVNRAFLVFPKQSLMYMHLSLESLRDITYAGADFQRVTWAGALAPLLMEQGLIP